MAADVRTIAGASRHYGHFDVSRVHRQKLPYLRRRAVTHHCGWSARFDRRGHQRDPTRQLWRIEKVNPLVAAEEMSARDPASDCVRPHSGSVERLTCDDAVVCRRQPLDEQIRLRPAPHRDAPRTGQFPAFQRPVAVRAGSCPVTRRNPARPKIADRNAGICPAAGDIGHKELRAAAGPSWISTELLQTERAGDDLALDLARATVDRRHQRVAHVRFHVVLGGVAVPAHHLHPLERRPLGQLGRLELGH